MDVRPEDIAALKRDKYDDKDADLSDDIKRLMKGEPLAYVIGWVPFLGLRLDLESRPLIPRTETEFWTESLIAHLNDRFGTGPFSLLDLCAGSGAIGLAALAKLPNAHVTLSELVPGHASLIRKNLELNGLDASRADVRSGDLFAPLAGMRFNVIATNPPYVPDTRTLEHSVAGYEPGEALFAGDDGLSIIRRIIEDVPEHLAPGGELWIECDISHIEEAARLLKENGARECLINEDQYGRPRVVVSYWD